MKTFNKKNDQIPIKHMQAMHFTIFNQVLKLLKTILMKNVWLKILT